MYVAHLYLGGGSALVLISLTPLQLPALFNTRYLTQPSIPIHRIFKVMAKTKPIEKRLSPCRLMQVVYAGLKIELIYLVGAAIGGPTVTVEVGSERTKYHIH
jgi:hypothetical protein